MLKHELEESVLGDVDQALLMSHVERISAVDRESGEPGDWQAAEYIVSYLSECGVPARMERIRNLVSMPISARLQLDDGTQVPCITQAYAASTAAEGLDAPLIELDADTPGQDLKGKIVVLPGLAAPKPCYDLERRGAAGLIFINSGDFPHNMAISPIWGMPTRGDLKELAQIPVVSVNRQHGQELLASMHAGAVSSATLVTRVETGLRDLPLCIADVIATGAKTERYVLLNGHVDSWHKGAIDNATGNAAMMEIARVLSAYRDKMTVNVRFVWWSGHSNGRYSGSDWYADHNWEDLHANAVVNFNIDAVGAKGATHYGRVDSSAQCFDVGYESIHRLSGQEPQYSRIARNGDQSFWGHGVPSLFQVLSLQPPGDQKPDTFVPGLPWYWHTTEDLFEHVGAEELALDCQIYLAAIWRFCSGPVYPFRFNRMANEIRENLTTVQHQVGDAYSFAEHLALADALLGRTAWLDELVAATETGPSDPDACRKLNDLAMRINRIAIPVHYCAQGPFRTDSALPSAPFPGLSDPALLHSHDSEIMFEAHLREIVREGNRIRRMLLDLVELLDGAWQEAA